ncbi:MAG TPA: MFS transporter [Solirubrobacteraceae bacterium]|jgi:EmrB/QacA subfamily drug resistance transporter
MSAQVIEEQEQQPAPERRFGSREAWILAVCCIAQFMVILDLSIINVALPHIQSALGFSSVKLQWVVDAYSILFASFLMLGGRAADRFGQRRMFVAGMALFAVASLIGGAANSQTMLVVARGLQGFAGAFMAAASLAIVTASFPPGPKLHKAIGTWAAMNGLGGAAGVLLGGIITEELSWRWVLLINPPIGIATALIAYAVVKDRRGQRSEHSFDLAGAITLTVGQIILVFGVVEAGLRGWSAALALIPIVAGIVLLAAFSYIERNVAKEPLVPVHELTKHLKVANLIVLLFSASLFAMWFVASLYLQQVLGLSPLHTGLIFLPMTLMIVVSASQAGRLVSRFGVRPVLGSGLILLGGGLVLLARIGSSGSGIVYVMIPGLLAASGIGMSIVPSTIAATQGAKPGQAGLASGLVNTSRQVGGGLGLAILGTLATQQTSHLIGLGHSVPTSLADGFRLAFLIGAGCVAAAAILTFTLLPGGRAQATPAPSPAGPGPAGAGEAKAEATPAATPAHKGLSALPGRVLAPAFVVIVVAFLALDFAFASSKGAPIGAYLKTHIYNFVTEPSLHPPKLELEDKPVSGKLAPGYILTANFLDVNKPPMKGQSGPLILDNELQPVWFRPLPEKVVASNLSLQTYEGKPALSWWQGVVTNTGATESGEDVIVNQHYQEVAHIKGVDGWKLTLHEMIVSGEHIWVTANKDIPRNLSKYGGAYNGALIDSAVQEYSLKTGKLLYNWDALKHISLSQSQATLPTNGFPWDAYHVNAIDLLGNGTFLVSMRDTWAAYLVNIESGKVQWTLGGRKSTYTFGPGAEFSWQHDVKIHPGGVVTMFDDHCCQLTGGGTYVKAPQYSRGLILKLDEGTHRATKLAAYGGGYGIESDYMGAVTQLPNGNVLVGWGSEPYLAEFTKSGEPLLEGKFPRPDLSYRTTFGQWEGLPLYPPIGAARQRGGKTVVYASWNGATQVASWRVLAGSSLKAGAGVASNAKGPALAAAPRSGFETAIPLSQPLSSSQTLQVQALDASGKVIGTSKPFKS